MRGSTEGGVHGQVRVVAVDVHAQGQGDVGHQRADGSQADDAQGLLIDLRPDEGGLALFHHGGDIHAGVHLLPHPAGGALNVAGGQQHGADHQLLDGVGVGAGGAEHGDARLGAAVQGDVVDAGTGPGDGQQVPGEGIVVELGGAHQNGVLVLLGVGDDVSLPVKPADAHRGDLVHCFDVIHDSILQMLTTVRQKYLRRNVRRWRRFRSSTPYYRKVLRGSQAAEGKKEGNFFASLYKKVLRGKNRRGNSQKSVIF